MFSIILAAALAVTPSVADRNAGAKQLDKLIDQIVTLDEDADATGNTARTRPATETVKPKAKRPTLRMDFSKGPRVL